MERKTVTIGTRGSDLALVQTKLVADALQSRFPALEIKTQVITTQGDTNLSAIPLDTVGKAWFTKEIEQALLSGNIDIAVHSLKDLPIELPEGLHILPVLTRGDPRDVLVSENGETLNDLPAGSIIGTDSIRRKAQILARREDVVVESVRGNVGTRLKKLRNGPYNALVIAAAGLERLGMLNLATETLDPKEFVPAVGQGTLVVEVRESDSKLREMIEKLQDPETVLATRAERAFSKKVEGGCKMPIACYAEVEGADIILTGMVGSLDAQQTAYKTVRGKKENAETLAIGLAEDLLQKNVLILHV